ncbi:MAG: subunit alpha of phenylalanyl-tRNA synthetase [Paenibacillus sp.]|nr:subunit alpha of phenylalanyl-tRNA synthetase [Paenibacillus sp.]
MKERLLALKAEALQELQQVSSSQQLNDLRVKYLGKKGPLTEILRGMGALSAEERPVIGQVANDVRAAIEEVLEAKQAEYQRQETEGRLIFLGMDIQWQKVQRSRRIIITSKR